MLEARILMSLSTYIACLSLAMLKRVANLLSKLQLAVTCHAEPGVTVVPGPLCKIYRALTRPMWHSDVLRKLRLVLQCHPKVGSPDILTLLQAPKHHVRSPIQ